MASSINDGFGGLATRTTGSGLKGALGMVVGAFAVLLLLSTTVTYVNPGYVGIVIRRAGGGVDPDPLEPGLHTRNPLLTGIEEYPVFMQNLVLVRSALEGSENNDEINVNSVEGQPVALDVSMSFELEKGKVPSLYQTFRTDIESIQHGYVKQSVRQALQEVVGSEEIANILGKNKAQVVARRRKRIDCCPLASRQHSCNTRWRSVGTARCRRSQEVRCR